MDVTLLLVAIGCLVVGLAVGSLLTRTLSPQEKKRKELENTLQQKDDELKTYQRDVADHFLKTANIVKEMTRQQQDISEHLATGAIRLASPEVSRQVQDAAFEGIGHGNRPHILSSSPAEPPKDYAPSVPGGVLNESYGLTDNPQQSLDIEGTTATSAEDTQSDDPTQKIA